MRRLVVLGAVAALTAATALPAQAATVTVSMRGLDFVPATARAAIGDTVTWRNSATDRHTTTAGPPTPWDSAELNPWGQSYTRVFPVAGSFPYLCTIHKSVKMTGVIKVALKVAPASGSTATTFLATLAKAGTTPPSGYKFVLQRATGSGAFSTLAATSATTASFKAPGKGTYKLRSGLQKTTGSPNLSWFSDPVTITVS